MQDAEFKPQWYRAFPAIVGAWIVTRIYLLMWLAYHPPNNADAELYAAWARFLWSGEFPAADSQWQYPPLFGAWILAVGSSELHASVMLSAIGLALDALIVAVLLATSMMTQGSRLGVWAWIVGGLAIGPLLYETLDIVPTFFAVLGLALAIGGRMRLAGASLGLGVATKLWPLVLLVGFRPRGIVRTTVWLAVTVVVTSLVMVATFAEAWSFLSHQGGRGLQVEAVSGFPWLLAQFLGLDVARSGSFGSVDFTGAAPQVGGVIVALIGLGALVALAILRMTGRLSAPPVADVSFTALLILVVTSRVNSPQYIVWLVAVGSVALTVAKTHMQLPVFLVLLAALMTQIVIAFYDSFLGVQALPLLAHSVRIVLLLLACFVSIKVLARQIELRQHPADSAHSASAGN
jgi:hypothetical protein